jgi:hypothetical protein
MRFVIGLAAVVCFGVLGLAAATQAQTASEGEGEGEGDGEGEGEGGPGSCTPGCLDNGAAEGLCTASGQLIEFPCPAGQRCMIDVCEPDPQASGPGGLSCQQATAGAAGGEAIAGALIMVGRGVFRRRRVRN